jgi:hypothetical protein
MIPSYVWLSLHVGRRSTREVLATPNILGESVTIHREWPVKIEHRKGQLETVHGLVIFQRLDANKLSILICMNMRHQTQVVSSKRINLSVSIYLYPKFRRQMHHYCTTRACRARLAIRQLVFCADINGTHAWSPLLTFVTAMSPSFLEGSGCVCPSPTPLSPH